MDTKYKVTFMDEEFEILSTCQFRTRNLQSALIETLKRKWPDGTAQLSIELDTGD